MINSPEQFSDQDIRVIGECLRAAAEGPFFIDSEFSTIFGLTRDEVAAVANQWPLTDPGDKTVGPAINNSINHLLTFPHKKHDVWQDYISVSPKEVYDVFIRWRIHTGRKDNSGSGKKESFLNLE